jgi:4-aminobutyrate aminotransferase/(S)-3-amino-2-methylpropionate transaminase
MDAVHPMGLGTTFGGNPVAAAVASEVIDVVSDSLFLGRVRELGELMARRLVELSERYGIVGDVRGLGMMRALELVRDRRTKEPAPEETERVISAARSKGLLLLKGGAFGNVIRLHPPLTVERELLERGLDLLEEALREVSSGASK